METISGPAISFLLLVPIFQSHNDISYLSHCEFAYHLKKDEICINPYHYIKTEPEFIQPQSPQSHQQLSILVPKFPTSSPESSTVSSYLDGFSNTVPLNIQYHALK
jgi:mothers against decapentaplegic homolog 3